VHVDRLQSIINDGQLWCDAEIMKRSRPGTIIGMGRIKNHRFNKLLLNSYPDLRVGDCVPVYFCPRSIMLYILHKGNDPDLEYRGGQGRIIHLEADLHNTVSSAYENSQRRWAFTLSNAGAYYFEDRNELSQLNEIDWDAVDARQWSGDGIDQSVSEGKQAEFLIEKSFSWHLVERIGVYSKPIYQQVMSILPLEENRPKVEIIPSWYY